MAVRMKAKSVPQWDAETHALVWNVLMAKSVSMVSVVRTIVFASVVLMVSDADLMAVSLIPAPIKNAERIVSAVMGNVSSAVLRYRVLLLRPASMVYASQQDVRII